MKKIRNILQKQHFGEIFLILSTREWELGYSPGFDTVNGQFYNPRKKKSLEHFIRIVLTSLTNLILWKLLYNTADLIILLNIT